MVFEGKIPARKMFLTSKAHIYLFSETIYNQQNIPLVLV